MDFQIGKAEVLRNGGDVALIGVGMMVVECLRAAESLSREGIEARVINPRTIKPLDVETVVNAAIETGAIVTAEDHNCFGGLGGAVAEVLVGRCPVPMEQVALRDTFARSGNGHLLLKKFGLTAEEIGQKARIACNRKHAREGSHVVVI